MKTCVIHDCGRRLIDRAWICGMHAERLRRLGTTYIHREPTCTQCERKPVANGLCRTHYMKLKRTGTFSRLRRPGKSGGRSHREKHLLNRYGLSLEKYEAMEREQDNRCAICQRRYAGHQLFVDHDHTTGEVRSLLCRHCNTMLGALETHDDSDTVITGLQAYCEAHCV